MGILLTISFAVLFIVFILLKKNREQTQPHENGMKEKPLGNEKAQSRWFYDCHACEKIF
jgi:hypothetical protein